MERPPLDVQPLFRSPLPVVPCDHATEGGGFRVSLGTSAIQIFPGSRAAYVQLGGDVTRVADVTGIRFESNRLQVDSDSEVYHGTVLLDAESLIVWKSRKSTLVPGADGERKDAPSQIDPPELASHDGQPDEERDRVTLVGRLGYPPKFRTTPKGTLVGSFSLGVHPEQGKTEWHQVVTFGSRAAKLQESNFAKGDEVQIIGYPHERQRVNTKTGEPKTVIEIYAAVVKTPKEKESSATAKPPPHEKGEAPGER